MTYISLLRGINVSGQKKIRMAELRGLYEGLGLVNVATYIQSGNVVFQAEDRDPAELKTRIQQAIVDRLGFTVPVELRTHDEIEEIVEACPFGPVDLDQAGTKVLVTFLSERASTERISGLAALVTPPEKLVVCGREIYLFCPDGYGRSKLSNAPLERKLGVAATTRNWRTIIKLRELSGDRTVR